MYNGVFLLTLFGVVGAKQKSDLVSLPAVGSDLSQVVGQVLYNFGKFFLFMCNWDYSITHTLPISYH